jgi:transcriptional regulator with XRE-family HTH domain
MGRRRPTPDELAAILHVAERARSRRYELELTQEALAEAAGIDPSMIQRIEGGRINPSLGTLVVVAKALQTTVEDLVTGI